MITEKTHWDYHWNDNGNINKFLIKLNIKGNYYLNYCIYVFLKKINIKKESLLEIGCGGGKLASLMSKVCKKIYLLDKSSNAIKLAKFVNKGKSNLSFVKEDIFKFKPRQKFDIVISLGLVEHFSQSKIFELIKKHLELVNDSGLVLIGVPAYTAFHVTYAQRNISHYGYQDIKAEFVMEEYLKSQNFKYKKKYLDYLNSLKGVSRILTYLNYLLFLLFKIDLNRLFPSKRGYFVVFCIKK